jgi:hypothetical protein
MEERLVQITRCMAELELCRADLQRAQLTGGPALNGPFLGQMDWLDELHMLVHHA